VGQRLDDLAIDQSHICEVHNNWQTLGSEFCLQCADVLKLYTAAQNKNRRASPISAIDSQYQGKVTQA